MYDAAPADKRLELHDPSQTSVNCAVDSATLSATQVGILATKRRTLVVVRQEGTECEGQSCRMETMASAVLKGVNCNAWGIREKRRVLPQDSPQPAGRIRFNLSVENKKADVEQDGQTRLARPNPQSRTETGQYQFPLFS